MGCLLCTQQVSALHCHLRDGAFFVVSVEQPRKESRDWWLSICSTLVSVGLLERRLSICSPLVVPCHSQLVERSCLLNSGNERVVKRWPKIESSFLFLCVGDAWLFFIAGLELSGYFRR